MTPVSCAACGGVPCFEIGGVLAAVELRTDHVPENDEAENEMPTAGAGHVLAAVNFSGALQAPGAVRIDGRWFVPAVESYAEALETAWRARE